ncbi:FAD-binding protein [Streptomyces sp. NWU339]|uniref:FAD/NAD(P)-binding protein n=1 Tax=Streptomyces sp. NWU339 TaxID=2185284 RepID=UPI000D67B80F|nr:FAD/NAD(P)-binding protein [Streptomyces sp. NWU339]PWI08943.1 FAD-binding protein [Streptomyces sp. NWU339]
MNERQHAIGLVGAGPRGLSVLERLCAQERKSPSCDRLTVHVVDPAPPGAGRVWRTAQPRELLMNTVACQVSVFTDASVSIEGPIEEGPSLYAWACALAHETGAGGDGLDADDLAEARALGPDSYPSRAFYGRYLEWVFDRLVSTVPGHITVRVHRARAVDLADEDGALQRLVLSDGTVLAGLDAVVLAQGHVDAEPTRSETELAAHAARHGLCYLAPANPADVDLADIAPGEPVVLRGLGLNFFDHMALLTLGRGGRFERGADGRPVYRPSGREPRLYAGSRRGVPYHARGENEKGAHGRHHPRLLTAAKAAELRSRTARGESADFDADVWPLIAKEVEAVYYAALLTSRGLDDTAFADRYLAAAPGAEEQALLDEAEVDAVDRWDWERVARPYGRREFTGAEDFHSWLLAYLRADVAHAREGNVSGPVKAALDVLRDLRNEIRLVVDHSGIDGASYRDALHGWYTPLNAFLSIGPPASRIEELIALIEAGVVTCLGPGLRVTAEDGAFVASSTALPDVRVRARALIEARLPDPDLRRTTDPLLRRLLETGQCAPYRIPGRDGEAYETGGLAVTERPYRLVDAAGRAHPRRFAYGVPTESVHWVTAAGIRPGVGSVTLEDADAIAAAVVSADAPPALIGADA